MSRSTSPMPFIAGEPAYDALTGRPAPLFPVHPEMPPCPECGRYPHEFGCSFDDVGPADHLLEGRPIIAAGGWPIWIEYGADQGFAGWDVLEGAPSRARDHDVASFETQAEAIAHALARAAEIDRAYEEHHAQAEREHRMEQRTGFGLCECGQYAVETHTRRTRQYGGGWDSYHRCLFCGRAEVCV